MATDTAGVRSAVTNDRPLQLWSPAASFPTRIVASAWLQVDMTRTYRLFWCRKAPLVGRCLAFGAGVRAGVAHTSGATDARLE